MIGLLLKIIFLPVTIVFGILNGIFSLLMALFTGGFSAAFAVLQTGIRICINLFKLAVKAVMSAIALPISVVGHHAFFFFILALGTLLYFEISHNAHKDSPSETQVEANAPPSMDMTADPSLQPVPAEQTKTGHGKQKPIVIEPVLKREDGNSAFATDLYKLMTGPERAYYSQVFYRSMNTLADGDSGNWNNGNINGAITVGQTFTNKLGDRCRPFNEQLKVHTIEQTIGGVACERGGGAWCKLKKNSTPACNLGGSGSFWGSAKRWFGGLF